MLLIVPSLKGHFLNYIELFQQNDRKVEFFELKNNKLKVFRLFWVLLFSKHKQVAFLHGEISIIQSFFMAILFFRKSFTLLFYYGFSYKFKEGCLKRSLFNSVVCLLNLLGIKLLYLEGSTSLLGNKLYNKFRSVNDPILIDFILDKPSVSIQVKPTLKFLIPGYLEDRKCIVEVIQALEMLTGDYPSSRLELTLLGQQSSEIESFLSAYLLENNNSLLEIIVKSYRFTDEELCKEMLSADCIFSVYKEHIGSSGIVINSIAIGKPVLFIPIGVLYDVANEMNIRCLPPTYSISDIYSSIEKLLSSEQYSHLDRYKFIKKRTKTQFIKAFYE